MKNQPLADLLDYTTIRTLSLYVFDQCWQIIHCQLTDVVVKEPRIRPLESNVTHVEDCPIVLDVHDNAQSSRTWTIVDSSTHTQVHLIAADVLTASAAACNERV